ncbi:MAG: serine hydrolase [Chitinophagaceae bacterium]|nr:serine hydrolase [Chitinophagaceae bacterium]MCW5904642.1 serine hydrolase [Chitinophagaceae bacterium]
MKKLFLLLSISLFAVIAYAQLDTESIDRVLLNNKKQLGNDAVMLVYKDDKVVYKKKTSDYFDERARVSIGNASSWLTATLILQYIENGTISLDTKIADYIPIYVPYSKKYITIGHCLAHLTGIEFKKNDNSNSYAAKFNTLEEMVNSYAKKEIRANTGTEFWYASMEINIAARVIEVVTKKRFEQLISQKVLRPLGMKSTSFSPTNGGCVNPAAGAESSANDYLNFLSMIVNKGVYKGKRILSEESVNLMFNIAYTQNMVKHIPDAAETFEHGFGTWVMEKNIDGKPAVVGATDFLGLWGIADLCRGYAMVLFPKKALSDAKKSVLYTLKEKIDEQLPDNTHCN